MEVPEKYYRLGNEVVPPVRIDAALLDFDETITSPFAEINGEAVRVHDISRILAAHTLGVKWRNDFLQSLTPELSAQSYTEAAEPTLEGSGAWLFTKAGIFGSHIDYDPANEQLQEFISLRTKLHETVLKDRVELSPGFKEFASYARDRRNLPFGLGMASMALAPHVKIIIDKFDLEEFLPKPKRVTLDTKVGILPMLPKPHRMVYDTAFGRLDVQEDTPDQRQRVIAVDDARGGVVSANAAGMYAIGFASNFGPEGFVGTPARHVVRDFHELLAFTKQVNEQEAA